MAHAGQVFAPTGQFASKGKGKGEQRQRKRKGKERERERKGKGRGKEWKWKGNCLTGAKAQLACAILVCVSRRYPENNPEQKIFPGMCNLSVCSQGVPHKTIDR